MFIEVCNDDEEVFLYIFLGWLYYLKVLVLFYLFYYLVYVSVVFFCFGYEVVVVLVIDVYGFRFGDGWEREIVFWFNNILVLLVLFRNVCVESWIVGCCLDGKIILF